MTNIYSTHDKRNHFKCPNCGKGYVVEFWDNEHDYSEQFNCYECDQRLELTITVKTLIDYDIEEVSE